MNTVLKYRSHGAGQRPQRGAVAITFGLTAIVLVGFIGLALDLGRFFVIKAELQNAMDACALSAASQLKPGANDPNALTRAVAYGKVFITGGIADVGTSKPGNDANIQNRVNFQSVVPDTNVIEITFAATNNGTYQTAADADPNTAKFVKCNYPLTGLPVLFMRVLNPARETQTVAAFAVATRESPTSSCVPVAVCSAPGGTSSNNFGYTKGQWITAALSSYGTGNFGWIDFSPPAGGAPEQEAILKGGMQCDISKVGDLVGAQGTIASLDEAWNTRFGWYKNESVSSAPPDLTGYAYSNTSPGGNWPWGSNAYDGTSTVALPNFKDARTVFKPYQTNQPPGMPNPGGQWSSTLEADHQAHGRADRRIVSAPVVDCSVWNTGGTQPPILGWACVLMLNPFILSGPPASPHRDAKVEYLGLASDADSPCGAGSEYSIAPVLSQ
jgi:Flp pilus assembly protein TadG